ncbi:hypothetical protein TNCV_2105911 [Trichonephila clavipes]|nr:hypothetical protein TNCV_2105911 [Trichonephila clavipes]
MCLPSMSQTCSIGFQVRRAPAAGHSIRCIVSASSMFSTRRAQCGWALSSWKTKGISNGSSVRDDIRSKYLVCIPSACQKAIPNDAMQVRTSAYADSTPYHPTCSSVL